MAVQELHMTREGMDTESICLHCKSKGVEPIVTSASHQLCGNPSRAVRFFCPNCHPVQDRAAPFLCREIDFKIVEEVSNELPRGKSCSADGIPQEYCKDGTVLFRERYRAAFNSMVRGGDRGVGSEHRRCSWNYWLPSDCSTLCQYPCLFKNL